MVAGVHQRDLQVGVVVGVGVDRDGGGLVVLGFGGHDVGHKGLRVAVVEREPGALNLDHHGVPGLEDVVDVVEAVAVLVDGVGAQRCRASQSLQR